MFDLVHDNFDVNWWKNGISIEKCEFLFIKIAWPKFRADKCVIKLFGVIQAKKRHIQRIKSDLRDLDSFLYIESVLIKT